MVAARQKNEAPLRATGWQIPGAMIQGVVLDPGIVYTSADVLMFSATNTVGLVATISATGIAATLRALSIVQPKFLEKYPQTTKIAFDDRTPLRAGGLALLVVGGAAVTTGAFLPAAASFLFAIANFRLAESISKKADNRAQVDPKPRLVKPSGAELTAVFIKRPELYLNAGFACAGLMSGGASLFILPVVAAAFGVGMRNALQEKPEHAGHPKIITASAAAVFSAIGYANGHGLIAAAHAINAATLIEMERRVTPGGMMQIIRDMAGSVAGLMPFGKKPAAAPKPRPAPEPVVPASQQAIAPRLTYTFKEFAAPQAPANGNDPAPIASALPDVKPLVRQKPAP